MAEAKQSTQVQVSLEALYECILDFEAYPKFATGVKQAAVVSRNNDSLEVKMRVEIMRPIEYVISVQHQKTADAARVSWTLKDGDFFERNDGLWELRKVTAAQTDVTYSLNIDFAVNVPSFILKGLIKTSLPKAISDFSEEAKRRTR